MTTLSFFAAASLPDPFLWQVRSFMRMHWTFLFGAEERLRPGLWWLETLAPVHVLLTQDDLVISYGAIVQKSFTHAGQTFRTAGLHGIFTFPDFRGEGYGGQLVAAATRHIHEQQTADIAMLFCPPTLRGFYAAAGWQHHPDAITLIGPQDSPNQIETDPDMPDIRMMLFPSAKGQQAAATFWDRPVYFGGSGW